MLDGFKAAEIETGETSIFARRRGSGPPVLLLHGFPETHLMWRGVAPLLAHHLSCPRTYAEGCLTGSAQGFMITPSGVCSAARELRALFLFTLV
jgi:hypothetical protein